MNLSTLVGLAQNAAFLIALALVFDTLALKPTYRQQGVQLLTGLIFGLLGMAVMMTPWVFLPGVVFDTRSVILSVGGLFFGVLPTLIAMAMTASLQLWQGGAGAWTGIAAIITAGVIGLIWRQARKGRPEYLSSLELYGFGIVVHLAILLWMLSLPGSIAIDVLKDISLPVMILYPLGTVAIGKLMISRLRRKRESDILAESEARWRSLTETSPDRIVTLDRDLTVRLVNTPFPGQTVGQMLGTPFPHCFEGTENQANIRQILETVVNTGEPRLFETAFFETTPSPTFFESRAVPRRLESTGEILGLTVSTHDITEHKLAKEQIKAANQRLTTILDNVPADIYVADMTEYRILYMNEQMKASFGQDLTGKTCWKVFRDGDGPCPHCTNDLLLDKNGSPTGVRIWEDFNPLNGKHYVNHDLAVPWTDNRMVRIQIALDINDRVKAEEQLRGSLREKETLLQEIHHRVKNNMQVVASLLKLQADKAADQHIKEALKESQGRVFAISAVHEVLHGSDNLSAIDLNPYLNKLSRTLLQTYTVDHQKARLEVDCDNVRLDIKKASPLGLIINELVSNALKYAFPGDRPGCITIRLKADDHQIELTVEDDGIGLPADFDWKTHQSLGLQLVHTLAERQLDGTVEMTTGTGTRFTIRFPDSSF